MTQPHEHNITALFQRSLHTKQAVADSDAPQIIAQMAQTISHCIEQGGKLLLCGNGGSAADAQHLAAELVVRLRPHINRQALPALSLSIDSSFMTACANDYAFDDVFARALAALGRRGDVLLGISTSGNSANVIKAFSQAQTMNITTCALLGSGGGKMKQMADFQYIVPDDETGRIQEAHIMLGHALMETIEDILSAHGYLHE